MRPLIKIIFMLTLMLAATCAQAQQRDAPAPSATEGGGFRLKGLDGKFYDTSEMKGDVLVVSFGATWCTPCTWELVAIEELKQEYAGKPVRFLWVTIEDMKRTTNNILRYYVKDRRLTVPVLRDPGGVALTQYDKTGTRIPVVVFFDREGHLSAPVHNGMSQDISVYKQMVRDRVNALINARQTNAEGSAATR
jgi:thiol-disulfide isomerase/thioredoxin